ncbi:hypothetical protein KC909_02000 [Candidatus Dojkabacteria bacterium]|uniref:ArsR family transcriptional regulator n=1 Tax=Candidatus Dojkabacteria bacterium TaxID=2099670 RepID=A0A955RJ80_9BACT|nr:hypothetical protein [Candidatus Dojkabacteria bacterium]
MANITKSLDSLFISKVRIKAIKYFLFNLDTPIHLRGAVRELKEEINAVRRELNRLEAIKFLLSETRGNRKYFSLNPEYPLLAELMGIFHKAFGLGGAVVSSQTKLGDVKYAILTYSFAQNMKTNTQNVDLVLIGDIDLKVLAEIVEEAEKNLGREIIYTVLKENEFNLRKKRRDAFVMELLINGKIILIGNPIELSA